ncbi:unnamed protein product [Nyctereutes procyonoides]|uniref:(raccoon dog) hypothetical protein n=1 Tax=Nyctereutes procyonoides TaxID=34880 RepID=A0A811Z0Q8_NYCPR|nr:unnamed protein product [Nyctereutes procyonoides]
MEYLSALNPSGLLRSTSPPPPQRPFRVCDHKWTATEALLLNGMLTLVLEEDGTTNDTCLMVLECGQSWSPSRSGILSYGLGQEKPKHSKDIARITFDVLLQAKPSRPLWQPQCQSHVLRALLHEFCDFQGLGPKKVLRELLLWTSALLQGLGHMLLGISSSLRHLVEGAEQWHWQWQGRLHPY